MKTYFELNDYYLKSIIKYDPNTGEFHWLVNRGRLCKAGQRAGTPRKDGYRQIIIHGRKYLAHRLAWFYMVGEWPLEIDHIDRIRSNNKWNNLRLATRSQNKANAKVSPGKHSKFIGVFPKSNGDWFYHIKYMQKMCMYGPFSSEEEAAKARDKKAIELFGEFAYTNFPREFLI